MPKPLALAALLTLATLPATAQVLTPDGWESYGREATQIACRGRPVLLTGNHTEITLLGPCRRVRLAGEHNDITVSLAPGGVFEITGAHNDVFWTPIRPAGTPPVLLDHGPSNTFHRR